MSEKLKNLIVISAVSAFIVSFSLGGIFSRDKEISLSERRPLAQFPNYSSEAVLSGKFMSEFENYVLDQFPLREQFRSLKAGISLYGLGKQDNNGIYSLNNYLSKLDYPLNFKSLDHAADRVNFIYNQYLKSTDCKIYFSIIPDKNYFLSDISKIPILDYSQLENYMISKINFASYINIFPTLKIEDYYRTDTHWRQEKIEDTAVFILESMENSYNLEFQKILEDSTFYGVYHGQFALNSKPDELWYIDNEEIKNCMVFDFETEQFTTIYDRSKLDSPDPYEFFLSGSKSIISIENPSTNSQKELIIFRDSFGSSIAPYFIESYKKITLIDTRYISPHLLDNFVDFHSCDDVLFLYSTFLLNNSDTLK